MYPSAGTGSAWSSGTRQAVSSVAVIKPSFTSFCKWPDVTVKGVQSCSAMARGGTGSNTSEILVFSPISFSLSLSSFRPSFFFRFREGGKKRMADSAKGCRGLKG
jgi:hypothetical protein